MNNEDMSGVFEKLNNVMGNNNISPDMINNLLTMLGNSSNNDNLTSTPNNSSNNNNSNDSSYNYDNGYSNYEDNNAYKDTTTDSAQKNTSGIDIEMLFKMKSIIDAMNVKDDPRANLLMSLKPYLKDSRKGKLDQYVQLMNMSKVMEFFPFLGGGKKNNE